ncbi:MAG: 23S rRNA (guanosine2251-2'-O)-methyltransferase [Candidatus Latescibacterota bacterium]
MQSEVALSEGREEKTDEKGDEHIWGRHEVAEALESGQAVRRIYFSRQARGEEIERIKELARVNKVRFDFFEVGKLSKVAGTRAHQDVVARLSPVHMASLDEVLDALPERATIVALDQVQNARNIGMCARTAAAAGAAALLLPARGGHPLNDEVMRASAGAAFRLPIVQCANLVRDLELLKERGFWIYGLDAGGQEDALRMQWPDRRVLVAGNESKGLRPGVRKKVDALIQIPLHSGVESLNVAVALGVALFADGVR